MNPSDDPSADRIEALDLSLFDRIPTQTTPEDRTSLLTIQRGLRRAGPYVYLEIGSHLGGTIQPHYADSRCRRIYSIDKRPAAQPDERGATYAYDGNSTQTMRDNLRQAFPGVSADKLATFDADASEVEPDRIAEAPDFCFIDGEHTNAAVLSDFRFCLSVTKPDALIATHDSGVVAEGIQAIRQELAGRQIPFTGMKLGGSVYVFALGSRAERWQADLAALCHDETAYFRGSAYYLRRLRREARLSRWPLALGAYRAIAAMQDWLYLNVYQPVVRGRERR